MGFKERILKELKEHPLSTNRVQKIAEEMGETNPLSVLGELYRSRTIGSFLDENTNPAVVTYYLLRIWIPGPIFALFLLTK